MGFLEDDSGPINGSNSFAPPPPIPSSTFSPNMGDLPGMPTAGGGLANNAAPPLFDALMQQPDWSGIGDNIMSTFKQTPPTQGIAPMGELRGDLGPDQATTVSVNGGPDQFLNQTPPPAPKNFFQDLGDQVKNATDDIGNWYENFSNPSHDNYGDVTNPPSNASITGMAGSSLDAFRNWYTATTNDLGPLAAFTGTLNKDNQARMDNVLGALGGAMGAGVNELPGIMVQGEAEPGSPASNLPDQGKILNGLLESILPAVGVAEPAVGLYKNWTGQNIQSMDALNAQSESLNEQGNELQTEIDSANRTGVVPPDLEQKLRDYQSRLDQFNKTSQQSESFWKGPGGLALNLIAQLATTPEQFSVGQELFKAQAISDPQKAAQQMLGSFKDAGSLLEAIANTATGRPGGIDTWNPQQIASSVSNLVALAAMIHGPLSMFKGGHSAETIPTEIPANGKASGISPIETSGIPTEASTGSENINTGEGIQTGAEQISPVEQQGSTETTIRPGATPETIGNGPAPINADFTNGNEQAPGIAATNAETGQPIRETNAIPPATGNGNAGNVSLWGSPEMDFGLGAKTPEVSDQTIQDLTGFTPKDYFAGLTPEQQAQVRNNGMSPDAVDAAKADQLEMTGTDVQNLYPRVRGEQPVTEAPAHFNEQTMRPMSPQKVGPNAEAILKDVQTPEDVLKAFMTDRAKMDNRVRALYNQLKDIVDPYGILKDKLRSTNVDTRVQATAPFNSPELVFNLNRPDPTKMADGLEANLGLYIKPGENPVADKVAKAYVNDLRDMAKNPALMEYNLLDHEATHQYDYELFGLNRDSATPWSDMVYNMIHDIPDDVLQGWTEQGLDLTKLIGGKLSEDDAIKLGKDLLEMSVHSWQMYRNIPAAQYAWGLPEVFANNVKDPQKAIDTAEAYGSWRQQALANRFGAKQIGTAAADRSAGIATNNANYRADQAAANQPGGNINTATADQGSGIVDWKRTSQGIPVNPLNFSPENLKHLDVFDHIHNEWMMTPAQDLSKVADKFKSAVEDLINSVRSEPNLEHADLVRSAYSIVKDAHDTQPDGGSLDPIMNSLKELEREAQLKSPQAGSQDLTPIVKRGEDFSRLGEYDVTIGSISYKIYRDPDTSAWYEANTGKHFTQNYLGSTRAEALDRLVERTRSEGPQAKSPELPPSIKQDEAKDVKAEPIAGRLDPKAQKTLEARLNLVGGPLLNDFMDMFKSGDENARGIYDKLGPSLKKSIDAALKPSEPTYGQAGLSKDEMNDLKSLWGQELRRKAIDKDINDLVNNPQGLLSIWSQLSDNQKSYLKARGAKLPDEIEKTSQTPKKAIKAQEVVTEAALNHNELPQSNQLTDQTWLKRAQQVMETPRHPAGLEAGVLISARDAINMAIKAQIPMERLGDLEQSYDLAMNRFQTKMNGANKGEKPMPEVTTKTAKAAEKVMTKPDLEGNVELDAKMAAEEAGYTLDSARDLLNGHVQYGYLINNKTKQILKATDERVNSGSWSPVTLTGKNGIDFKYDPVAKEMKVLNENHVHLGQRSDIIKSWDEDFKTYLKGELRRGTVFMPQNITPEQNTWRNGVEVKGPGGQPFRPTTKVEQAEMLNHLANLVDSGFVHPMEENPMTKAEAWQQWTDFGRSLSTLGLSRAKPPELPDLIGQVSRADLMKRNKALSKRAEAAAEFSRNLETSGYDPLEINRLDNSDMNPPGGPPKDPTAPPGGDDFEHGPNREIGDIWNESEDRFVKLAAHGRAGKDLGNGLQYLAQHIMGMQDIYNYLQEDKLAASYQEAQYNAGKYLTDNIITPAFRKLIPDVSVREAISHALDVNDVPADQRAVERQARIDALPTPAARDTAWSLASIHDFLGNVMRARQVTNTAVDYYITHAFKPDARDKDFSAWWENLRNNILYGENSGGPSAQSISRFRQKRRTDPETGEYLYPTMESLEQAFEKPVYKDAADLLNIHTTSALYALSMKDMKDYLGTRDYVDGNGYQAPSIVSYEDFKNDNLSGAIDKNQYRAINLGTYRKPFMGYLVRRDLADQMELYSNPSEGPGPLNALSRGAVKLGSLFRGGTFVSFFHSLNVHSLMASKIAAEDGPFKGFLEGSTLLPAWQKSLKMTITGNKLLRDDPKYVAEKLIKMGGMKPPESLTEVEGMERNKALYQKIPGIKQMYDLVWNKDLGPAAYGLAKYLDDTRRAQMGNLPMDEATEIQHYSSIVAEVNRTMGLIPREDLPNWFKALSKATLTGSEFTFTQGAMLARAIPGSTKIPGLRGAYSLRERSVVKGVDPKVQQAMIKRSNRIGTASLFYGLMGMTIASEIENVVSGVLSDGQPNNFWDNFMDSPTHVFDIYHGVDANGRRMYWHNPLYGAFEELANYGMAFADAKNQNLDDGTAIRYALSRMTGKIVPTIVAPLEALTNIELYKFVAGYKDQNGNPTYNLLPDPVTGKGGDSALNQLSQLLDAMHIPQGPGQLRDRLAFVANTLKGAVPPLGLAPTTTPEVEGQGITNAQGIMNNPLQFAGQAALGAGLKLLGTYEQYGPSRAQSGPYAGLTGQQIYNPIDRQRAQAASDQQLLFQIANQPPSNDPKVNQQRLQQELAIAARNNWTPDQMTKIIQQQQTAFDKAQFSATQQALQPNSAQRAADAAQSLTGAIANPQYITVNGQNINLSAQDSQTLQRSMVQRRLDVVNMLNTDPTYRALSAFDKASMQDTFNQLADSLTRQQAAQQLGYANGALTDQQIEVVLHQTLQERDNAAQTVMNTEAYQTADPVEQKRMVQQAQSLASTLVSDAYLKGIKGVTPDTMPLILHETLQSQAATRSYVETTPWFQMADPATQARMIQQYDSVAAQLARNEVVNMPPAVVNLLNNAKVGQAASPFNSTAVTLAAKNIVNTQEATLELLHNQDFYMNADPNTQAQLDSKYIRLARNIAAYQASGPASGLVTDYREVPAAFKYGLQSSIVGSIQGEQAQFDLQNQFGGANVISGYAAELAATKKNYRMSVGANTSTSTINRVEKNIEAAFLYNNPDYAAYLKAQAQFKKYSPEYSLTAALNNSEYTRAAQLTQAYGIDASGAFMGPAGSITGDITSSADPSMADSLPIDVNQINPNDINGSLIAQGIDPNSVDPQTLDNIIAQTQMNG